MSSLTLILFSSLLFFIAFIMWGFLLFSLKRQYRYATLLFDLLPYYLPFTFFAFISFTFSVSLLSYHISLFFLLFLLPALPLAVFLAFRFHRWSRCYSLKRYISFLDLISDSDRYVVHLLRDSSNIDPKRVNIFLRHDVDLSLSRLQRLTELEYERGIRSTCLFRFHSPKYSFEDALPIIKQLDELGFEIGYHYETLAQSKGNKERALSLFREELSTLRQHVTVTTISHHGDRYHNEQLLEYLNLDDLGLSSAYDLKRDLYLTDTGGNDMKRSGGEHIFDRLSHANPGDVVQILIHADWWY
ncbi:MAG: hypothetical protein ACTSYD_14345 [Candidatus Heimdallarchaeaceae archaeon]